MKLNDIPDDLDDRLLFADSGRRMGHADEHQRLKDAVVEAVKLWRQNENKWQMDILDGDTIEAVDTLLQFEQEHES